MNRRSASPALCLGLVMLMGSLSGCAFPHSSKQATNSPQQQTSSLQETSGCPSGWKAAVVISTQTGKSSEVVFTSTDTLLERRSLGFLGFEPAPGRAIVRDGNDAWMYANGDQRRSAADVIRYSTSNCTHNAYRVDESALTAVAPYKGQYITTYTPAGGATLRLRKTDGTLLAENAIPGMFITALKIVGDSLYAAATFSEDIDGGDVVEVAVLIELDPSTLLVKKTIRFDGADLGGYSIASDASRLFVPAPALVGGKEGRSLEVLTLPELQRTEVELPSPNPFIVEIADNALYIGHTFFTQAFHAFGDYRYVSRYDLTTGAVTTLEVGGSLMDILASGTSLVVLNYKDSSTNTATVSFYDLSTLKLTSSVDIPLPTETKVRYYVSGLMLPPQ